MRARALLDLVDAFPNSTWGRDEQGAGEMWNSNSLTSWLLVRSGHDLTNVRPPERGRAPGWDAGRVVGARGWSGAHRGGATRGQCRTSRWAHEKTSQLRRARARLMVASRHLANSVL